MPKVTVGSEDTALDPAASGGRWKLQPHTITMQGQKSTPSNRRKRYINTPDQKEKDREPEINPDDTEIYNLNDREFKIAIT